MQKTMNVLAIANGTVQLGNEGGQLEERALGEFSFQPNVGDVVEIVQNGEITTINRVAQAAAASAPPQSTPPAPQQQYAGGQPPYQAPPAQPPQYAAAQAAQAQQWQQPAGAMPPPPQMQQPPYQAAPAQQWQQPAGAMPPQQAPQQYAAYAGQPQPAGAPSWAAPPVSFVDAFKICLQKKYATFRGRASRSEYWYFSAPLLVVALIFTFFVSSASKLQYVNYALLIATLLPGIAVSIRRLHDTGKSGRWLMLPCVLVIVWYAALIIIAMPELEALDKALAAMKNSTDAHSLEVLAAQQQDAIMSKAMLSPVGILCLLANIGATLFLFARKGQDAPNRFDQVATPQQPQPYPQQPQPYPQQPQSYPQQPQPYPQQPQSYPQQPQSYPQQPQQYPGNQQQSPE